MQLYAEPFVSAGDYTSFKELVNGRARYADRYAAIDYDAGEDSTRLLLDVSGDGVEDGVVFLDGDQRDFVNFAL